MALFSRPVAVAVNAQSIVYVADSSNNLIRVIYPNRSVFPLAGSEGAGVADGIGAAASFNGVNGISVDPNGTIWAADSSNNRIRKITPSGIVTTVAGSVGVVNPRQIAFDVIGSAYICEGNRIRRLAGGVLSTFAGSGAASWVDAVGTNAAFNIANGIARRNDGSFYVADLANNYIRLIYPNQSVITFAGKGTASASDGTGPAAGFSGPNGLDVDQNSVLYVADMNNNLIRTVSPSGDVRTIIGSTPGSANGFGAAAKLNHPATLAVLPDGNLIICDWTTT